MQYIFFFLQYGPTISSVAEIKGSTRSIHTTAAVQQVRISHLFLRIMLVNEIFVYLCVDCKARESNQVHINSW